MKPYIIVLEGPDNVGKTTMVNYIKERLEKERGLSVSFSKQPCEPFRQILLSIEDMDPLARQLLMTSAIAETAKNIKDIKDDVIIFDRLPLISGYVYGKYIQGGLSEDILHLLKIINLATVIPDEIIILDDSYENIQKRANIENFFDAQKEEIVKAIIQTYKDLNNFDFRLGRDRFNHVNICGLSLVEAKEAVWESMQLNKI